MSTLKNITIASAVYIFTMRVTMTPRCLTIAAGRDSAPYTRVRYACGGLQYAVDPGLTGHGVPTV